MLVLCAAAMTGTARLDASINGQLLERYIPRVDLLDLPPQIASLARPEIHARLAAILDRPWLGPEIPRAIAQALKESGWIEQVNYVRRSANGQFHISCRYHVPMAMIQAGSDYYLVDREGVRLPGRYGQDSAWKVVSGVAKSPPAPGARWEGDEVRAGLAVVEAILREPFAEQIVSVSVENHAGRRNRWKTHIELLTDQPNGRIRWGSAPGKELEENTAAQKLAILRQNFHQTGRADAHYLVIDVSTFPDQFTVPG